MIELIGLDKSFGSRRILSAASLTVRSGESVALVGANGSGKTTTLRCAVGLAHVSAGRIRIDGIDPLAQPCDARARLSYLPQRTDFPGTLTVREILSVVRDLRGAPAAAVDREVESLELGGDVVVTPEDVRSVREGFECGVGVENFNDVNEGDVLEFFETVEVPR